jgi:putative FmdB family regulatory protein
LTPFFAACRLSEGRDFSGEVGMPSYSYRCDKCGKRFARVERLSMHGKRTPACPKCGSRKARQVFGTFFAKTSRKS